MKYFLALLFFLTMSISQAQTKNNSSDILKWVHATINIECEYANENQREKLSNLLTSEKINLEEYIKKQDSLDLLPRPSGTAIFVLYNKKYYLITARHVILDTTYSNNNNNKISPKIFLVESPQTLINHSGDVIDKNGNLYIKNRNVLAILYKLSSYELSSPQQDLGVIGLDDNYFTKLFTNKLIQGGYTPITLSDINTLCSIKEGEKIFAVGYPVESEIFNKGALPKPYLSWEGWSVTLPTISWGTIGNVLKNENHFEGNIFVYHGFSGGAVIAKNKLIGITSGETRELGQKSGSSPNIYFVHHSLFIKSSLIIPLLKKLESRLKRNRNDLE